MKSIHQINTWHIRIGLIMVIIGGLVLTGPVNTSLAQNRGDPVIVQILTQPTASSFGVTHDGNPVYVDRAIPGGDSGVTAMIAQRYMLDARVGGGRYTWTDFNDRVDSAVAFCDEPEAKIGPIKNYLSMDADGHCVLHWPPTQCCYIWQTVIYEMFDVKLKPGQTFYKDGLVKYFGKFSGYDVAYTLVYDQPLAVTLVGSDGTRRVTTTGTADATLYYWTSAMHGNGKVIGHFRVPLTMEATPCPAGVCP